MPQSSPSVLVIRLDGIGDALALTPLLAALRAQAIETDVVLSQRNARVFSPSAVRSVQIAPFALRSGSRENLERIARFGATLRARCYTHALVATEDAAGYRLARAAGAPQRVGFANGWGKPMKTLWVRSLLTRTLYRPAGLDARKRHECEVLFALGSGLVAEPAPTRDVARLRALVLDDPVTSDDRVALQITGKWLQLGASAGDVAALARALSTTFSVRAIAAADEREFADGVERGAGLRVERFESLAPWKSAIAGARALVAPDSGATHVAGMTGTPAVALFAPQRALDRQVARWHPWAAPYRIVTVEKDWPERTISTLRALLSLDRA